MPDNEVNIIEDSLNETANANQNDKEIVETANNVVETKEENCTEANGTPAEAASNGRSYDIKDFKLTKILSNNIARKSIALLGKFPNISDKDDAIVFFEKKAFKESDVQTNLSEESQDDDESALNSSYFNDDLEVQTEFVNNIYGSYQCIPKPDLNTIKASVVYPATDKHIKKYSICQKYLINETPSAYTHVTLPYIEAKQFSLEWVYNILEHKQEADRIVFEDTDPEVGFILLPDMKWDGHTIESLYLLVIPHKKDIKSLRDLTRDHLPLLRNIEEKATKAIEERYGLSSSEIRMYFHYQPSFYHLHVHINPIQYDAPGARCDKSHMLTTVINNLELMPDYYQKATLPFVLYEGMDLLDLYEKEFNVRKTQKRKASEEKEANGESESDCEVPAKIAKTSDEPSQQIIDAVVD